MVIIDNEKFLLAYISTYLRRYLPTYKPNNLLFLVGVGGRKLHSQWPYSGAPQPPFVPGLV